jgi:hypothetical protein
MHILPAARAKSRTTNHHSESCRPNPSCEPDGRWGEFRRSTRLRAMRPRLGASRPSTRVREHVGENGEGSAHKRGRPGDRLHLLSCQEQAQRGGAALGIFTPYKKGREPGKCPRPLLGLAFVIVEGTPQDLGAARSTYRGARAGARRRTPSGAGRLPARRRGKNGA